MEKDECAQAVDPRQSPRHSCATSRGTWAPTVTRRSCCAADADRKRGNRIEFVGERGRLGQVVERHLGRIVAPELRIADAQGRYPEGTALAIASLTVFARKEAFTSSARGDCDVLPPSAEVGGDSCECIGRIGRLPVAARCSANTASVARAVSSAARIRRNAASGLNGCAGGNRSAMPDALPTRDKKRR